MNQVSELASSDSGVIRSRLEGLWVLSPSSFWPLQRGSSKRPTLLSHLHDMI